mgnify:CR=1 FL=1
MPKMTTSGERSRPPMGGSTRRTGARTGSVSYFTEVDSFVAKVQRVYEDNDWVLVIPGQEKENLFKEYEDISGNAIGIGVDTLTKIGKEVGSIFKKD